MSWAWVLAEMLTVGPNKNLSLLAEIALETLATGVTNEAQSNICAEDCSSRGRGIGMIPGDVGEPVSWPGYENLAACSAHPPSIRRALGGACFRLE